MRLSLNKKSVTIRHEYEVNELYSTLIRQPETVVIEFINGKFTLVEYSFGGPYSRDQWHLLQAINQEIGRLEEMKGE